MMENILKDKDITNMPAIILWEENWDHGILGIECSKLLEEYKRPVFLFTKEGIFLFLRMLSDSFWEYLTSFL